MQENNKAMFIKRTLACLMAVIMLVCAAPLSGFVGLDLGLSASAIQKIDYDYELNDDGRTVTITDCFVEGEEITVPYMLGRYYVTGIGGWAFRHCTGLTKINLPKGLTSIGNHAFENCTSLTEINLPESLILIGEDAFLNCTSLTKINLPEGLTSIGYNAFEGCTSLTEINLPESLIELSSAAFSGCTNLTEINLFERITDIGAHTFKDCIRLTEIKLPKSLISLGYEAFYGCTSLTDVYYAGTQEQWKELVISLGETEKKNLAKANIHYNVPVHIHTYKSKVTKPTCTEDGYTTHTCTCKDCGKSYKDTIVKATGKHTYKNVVTKATFTNDGKTVTKCTGCGKITKTVPIKKVSTVKLSKTSYTYNGKVQKPSVTVKDSAGKALKSGTDYTVTYPSGMKNVGRYSVKITLKGKYAGTKTLTFDILPKATAKLTATQTTTSIKLTWSKVTGAKGYRVYKYDTKTKKYVKLADTTKTTYTINKLKAGTTYKYQVKAYGKSGNTTLWGTAKNISVTTPKIDVPKTLKATQTTTSIKLTWSKVTGAKGYRVYKYDTKTKKYVKLADTTKTTYTINKLKAGTTYKYQVKAYGKSGKTTIWSAAKSITTATKPATPSLTVKAGAKKATLSWKKITGATGYELYMATSKNGKYTKITTISKGATVKYTKPKLTKGKTYYFKMRTVKKVDDKNIYSAYSAVKSVKVK